MALTTETTIRTSPLLWLGVAAPLLRHLFIYSLGIATPGYSARRDFLSELSAFDAPYGVLMGLFGVGLVGLMMIVAAFGLYRAIDDRPLANLTACLVGLSGLGFVFVALAPCDPACIPLESSLRMQVHLLGGLVGMGAEVTAALAFGAGALMRRKIGALDATSLVLGIVGLLALFMLFAQPMELAGNSGLVQRVVQGSGDLWLLMLCWSYARRMRVA
jgi:hypothetical membrane protein